MLFSVFNSDVDGWVRYVGDNPGAQWVSVEGRGVLDVLHVSQSTYWRSPNLISAGSYTVTFVYSTTASTFIPMWYEQDDGFHNFEGAGYVAGGHWVTYEKVIAFSDCPCRVAVRNNGVNGAHVFIDSVRVWDSGVPTSTPTNTATNTATSTATATATATITPTITNTPIATTTSTTTPTITNTPLPTGTPTMTGVPLPVGTAIIALLRGQQTRMPQTLLASETAEFLRSSSVQFMMGVIVSVAFATAALAMVMSMVLPVKRKKVSSISVIERDEDWSMKDVDKDDEDSDDTRYRPDSKRWND